ncbi:hypothetical protein [Kibdelosporangium aridum]|uniref:Uncharacterized protein n=1 Tax=Kibdelosporangium aridum TaxID=2030 RepID=A0A1Y5XX69_KIBAR|nr:hypothetical protein [Kibdelosporangium aridum]SMD20631.1 hypothetical protein SAMN05661093_06513 [Kibdelosporangium aridum]
MNEVLASTLRKAVYERLDYLDRLVNEADVPSRASLADSEIARMTAAWRSLLADHEPDERGRCRACGGWRRRRPHPCSVWTTAHKNLIVVDTRSTPTTGRHTAASYLPTAG